MNLIKTQAEICLTILFVIFLFMGYDIPQPLADFIDTIPGKIIVVIISLMLFVGTNVIVGIVGFFVAFELIKRSMKKTGNLESGLYTPSEYKKISDIDALNNFSYTLEEEVVYKMAPPKNNNSYSSQTYQPILEKIYETEDIQNV
jgi:hypothetical protein